MFEIVVWLEKVKGIDSSPLKVSKQTSLSFLIKEYIKYPYGLLVGKDHISPSSSSVFLGTFSYYFDRNCY